MSTSGPPPVVPGFRLIRPIGAGGMGSVYEAEKLSTHETFAVKLIREHLTAEQSYLMRFEREIQVLRAIRHPNVVDVYEWSFGDPTKGIRPYVVMKLLEGESVEQMLRREKIVAPSTAVGIMLQALEGLAAAHGQGVLHRDLGPSNIFLEQTPSGKLSVKLLDFGLARAMFGEEAGRAVTQEGTLMGKPAYVAPEHFLSHPLDERADLYACGIVLFRLLAGRLPYKSVNAQMLWVERWAERETSTELPSVRAFVPDVPEAVAKVVARSLRKQPHLRYRTAREMQNELLQAEASLQPAGVPPRPITLSSLPAAKRPAALVAPAPPSAEAHSSTVVGRSSAAFTQPSGSRRSIALAAALVVFAALAVVLAVRFAMRRDEAPAAAPPVAAGVPVLSADAGLPVAPPPEQPAKGADVVPPPPESAPGAEAGEPDGGAVKVTTPEPDAVSPPPPDAGPAVPPQPRRDAGAGQAPRAATIHLAFAGLPATAHVSVGGQAVDPSRGVDLPQGTDPVLVVVNVPGGRYERWSASVAPDRDRTVRPDLQERSSGTASPPDAAHVVVAPVPDAGTARPPADTRTAVRDAGSGQRDGRLGTTFITNWDDQQ
jgi:serine/threonine-protein kinase